MTTFREINNKLAAKAHTALEKAVEEFSLLTSDHIEIDQTFNRKHVISAFYDLPSPPPFSVRKEAEYVLKPLFFQIQDSKVSFEFIRVYLWIDKHMTTMLSLDYNDDIPLTSIAKALGLAVDSDLSHHSLEISKWALLSGPLYFFARPVLVLLLIMTFIITTYVSTAAQARTLSPQGQALFIMVMMIIILLVSVVYLVVPIRLFARWWTRKYQESICVRELIYLLFELTNHPITTNKETRRNIQYRLNRLARYTHALAEHFSSPNKHNQQWAQNHFSRMSAYIEERERWLLAPRSTTMQDLRRDVESLAGMYISGNYGMFQWNPSTDLPQKPDDWLLRALKTVERLAIFAAPIGLMIWLLAHNSLLSSMNISANVIAILLVAWILLGLDSFLKLGVVTDVLKLAKGLRDLA